MSGHTPGPWRVTNATGDWSATNDSAGSSCYVGIAESNGDVVALAVAHDVSLMANPDSRANARLIAAAPILLKALTDLVANQDAAWVAAGFTDEQIKAMPYLKPARAAIATATGGAA